MIFVESLQHWKMCQSTLWGSSKLSSTEKRRTRLKWERDRENGSKFKTGFTFVYTTWLSHTEACNCNSLSRSGMSTIKTLASNYEPFSLYTLIKKYFTLTLTHFCRGEISLSLFLSMILMLGFPSLLKKSNEQIESDTKWIVRPIQLHKLYYR